MLTSLIVEIISLCTWTAKHHVLLLKNIQLPFKKKRFATD